MNNGTGTRDSTLRDKNTTDAVVGVVIGSAIIPYGKVSGLNWGEVAPLTQVSYHPLAQDLTLPVHPADDPRFVHAVRFLRDRLLESVDADMRIRLAGRLYRISWADRRRIPQDDTAFWMTSGMRVVEHAGPVPADVVPTGEEQITLLIDGERLVFHLVGMSESEAPPRLPDAD